MAPNSFEGIRFIIVGIVRNAKGEILLIKRVKKETGSDGSVLEWSFPGGRLHPPESREDCAKREIREETGYDIRPIRQISTRRHPQIPIDIAYYLCQLTAEEPVAEPSEPDEVAEIKWVAPADLKNYLTTDLDPNVARELGIT